MTPTYGINGPFLGPAIRVRRGDNVSIKVTNSVNQDITIHWHGLKIPGDVDGGPYTVINRKNLGPGVKNCATGGDVGFIHISIRQRPSS